MRAKDARIGDTFVVNGDVHTVLLVTRHRNRIVVDTVIEATGSMPAFALEPEQELGPPATLVRRLRGPGNRWGERR